MSLPPWLEVIDRPFPSAVLVVVRGPRPVVVDPGSLTDADLLDGLIAGAGVDPGAVATVICTHYHSDHVGAMAVLQDAGAQVAAHARDAAMVNARDQQTCASAWLDQPVFPYRVDRALTEGDIVSTGEVELEVLHTPGHTLGAISLWEPDSRALICGDALHAKDTPWIATAHEGAGSLARALITLDRIEQLDPVVIVSGHGPVITEPADAIARTRERFARWAADPMLCAIYAAKRIFVYRLMLEPLPSDQIDSYLETVPWVRDLAASADAPLAAFAETLLESLTAVLIHEDGLLRTTAPHRPSPSPVPWHYADLRRWPAVSA